MPILQHKDILLPGKVFDKLQKELLESDKLIIKITEDLKKFQEQTRAVNKTGSGKEAKQRIELTAKLSNSTIQLTGLQKQRQAVEKQLNAVFVKNLTANEKRNKLLIKGKTRLQETNKLLKQQAKEELGLVDATGKLTKARNKAQRALKNSILLTGKNSAATQKATKEFRLLDGQLRSVTKRARGFGGGLRNIGSQLLGAAGITSGVYALVGGIKNAVNVFKNFDKAGSKLAAILGKDKDAIKGLIGQAKQLGATTAFTASQVLEANTELAKLGFTAEKIQKAIPGILDLAAATGTDLAQSAELTAATLNIFNLEASKSGKVADILAKSTTISSLSMEKLATILPTVGKTAQIAGVSLEKTAALAGTLTDRGLDASTAATSLRNIFLELSNKGITWEEAMQKINASTDKNKTAMDLFGKRAASAGVILAETGDTTEDLTGQLKNATGAANEMAEAMLDNLAGDMTKAQSAWEGFVLSIESGNGVISKELRKVVQGFTEFLGQITTFNDTSKSSRERAVALKDSLENANPALKAFSNATGKVVGWLLKLNPGLVKSIQKLKELIGFTDKYAVDYDKVSKIQSAADEKRQSALDRINAKIKKNTKELNENTKAIDSNLLALQILTEEILNAGFATEAQTAKLELLLEAQNKSKINIEAEAKALLALVKERKELNIELQKTLTLEKLQGAVTQTTKTGMNEIIAAAKAKQKAELDTRMETISGLTEMNDAFLEDQAKKYANFVNEKKRKEALLENFKLQAVDATGQIITQGFSDIQDQKVQRSQDKALAEEEILKQQLDKNLINEIEYERKLAESRKKARVVEAKANKRKALFDIGIQTAVGVVKTIGNLGFPAALAAIPFVILQGALQAAIVAARPLKFAKGTEKVEGKGTETSDSVPAMLSRNERVVSADINKQLNGIPNDALPELVRAGLANKNTFLGLNQPNSDGLLASLLMQGNKTNQKLAEMMANLGWTYEDAGYIYSQPADGSRIIKVKK